MAWTSINIDPCKKNIDSELHIPDLGAVLLKKISTDTYCNLNVCVNSLGMKIPDGYSRYILGFWFEVFDENVFLNLYKSNPQAEFIILTDLHGNDLKNLDRCQVVRLLHWKWFLKQGFRANSSCTKKYKISSLSNKVNQYRFFITAKLLQSKLTYVTWHANYDPSLNFDYMLKLVGGTPNKDGLLVHADKLKFPINQETFQNDPGLSLSTSNTHPAYAESLINSINETKDVSWHPEFGILPGPYLTEKTWKPLIFGNALLFAGQVGIKTALEDAGFKFDYPWDNAYSNMPGDLDRLETLLNTIDQILTMSVDDIEVGISESIKYNQDLILSKKIDKYVDQINLAGLSQLEKII